MILDAKKPLMIVPGYAWGMYVTTVTPRQKLCRVEQVGALLITIRSNESGKTIHVKEKEIRPFWLQEGDLVMYAGVEYYVEYFAAEQGLGDVVILRSVLTKTVMNQGIKLKDLENDERFKIMR